MCISEWNSSNLSVSVWINSFKEIYFTCFLQWSSVCVKWLKQWVFCSISRHIVTFCELVTVSGRPLSPDTLSLLLAPHCPSVLRPPCCCCACSPADMSLWSPPLLQLDSTRCWSVTRSSTWAWWRTWGWEEPALLTDGAMRSSCRGKVLVFLLGPLLREAGVRMFLFCLFYL